MATTVLDSYYYDEQFKNYELQFAAVFAGMKVMIGRNEDTEPRLIHVPIHNASKDRMVAHIKTEFTQNKVLRLPIMSYHLMGVEQDPSLRKGIGATKRNTYNPVGGQFPDDLKVVEQRQPVPYVAQFELAIWASNRDQYYQILEQILTLFDPILQIQTSDEVFDTTKITKIELMDIRPEENMPAGADRRVIQTRLTFSMPVYLRIPNDVHSRFVKDIYMRIGAIGTDVNNSYDIISDLDAQGAEYEKVFSLDDVDID